MILDGEQLRQPVLLQLVNPKVNVLRQNEIYELALIRVQSLVYRLAGSVNSRLPRHCRLRIRYILEDIEQVAVLRVNQRLNRRKIVPTESSVTESIK